MRDVLGMVMAAADHDVHPKVRPDLVRPTDIPHLVGDSTKLRETTGWKPELSLEQAIREVVDAQTH